MRYDKRTADKSRLQKYINCQQYELKALLRTNVLNDVTAAPFLESFSQLPAAKNTKNSAAVMSLRTFVRSSAFNRLEFGHGSTGTKKSWGKFDFKRF